MVGPKQPMKPWNSANNYWDRKKDDTIKNYYRTGARILLKFWRLSII